LEGFWFQDRSSNLRPPIKKGSTLGGVKLPQKILKRGPFPTPGRGKTKTPPGEKKGGFKNPSPLREGEFGGISRKKPPAGGPGGSLGPKNPL